MRTKVILPSVLFFILLTFIAQAQPAQRPFRERVEAARVAYITKSMQLSPQEARIFWPLYDAYMAKVQEQRQQRLEFRSGFERLDAMSDDEVNKMLDARMAQAEAMHKARKEFISQLRKDLSPRKAAMFIRAEDEFQREVVERIRPEDDRPLPPARRRP
ncbi:MAG: hypothetical protein IPM52_01820 [Bacteroidetes bacterium]|nr:hypothetical protein [Bacteroidota bacterium]